jgi:hypothetical protein
VERKNQLFKQFKINILNVNKVINRCVNTDKILLRHLCIIYLPGRKPKMNCGLLCGKEESTIQTI